MNVGFRESGDAGLSLKVNGLSATNVRTLTKQRGDGGGGRERRGITGVCFANGPCLIRWADHVGFSQVFR